MKFQQSLGTLVAVLGMGVSGIAQAVPVIYDFTGHGQIETFTGVGTSRAVTFSGDFYGTVTIDVVGAPNSVSATQAASTSTDNPWIDISFQIQWLTGQFAPAPVPNQTSYFLFPIVRDNFDSAGTPIDSVNINQTYTSNITGHRSHAQLFLQSDDVTWLTDLSFPELSLAPPSNFAPNTWNRIRFQEYDLAPGTGNYNGFTSEIYLDSLVARSSVSVPEPGTIGLMCLALLGVAVSRRSWRRLMA